MTHPPQDPERPPGEIPPDEDPYALESSDPAPRKGHPALAPPTTPEPDYSTEGSVARQRRERRREIDVQSERDAFREGVLVPLITLVACAGIVFLVRAVFLGFDSAGFYLLRFAIGVPIGVGVYVFLCMLWIGLDEPIHLVALRIAAIFAAVDIAVMLTLITCAGVFAFTIPVAIITYVALLVRFMDIDLVEAIVVGLLTWGARVLVFYVNYALTH